MKIFRLTIASLVVAATFATATLSAFASAAHLSIRDVDTRAFPVISLTVTVTGDAKASDITVNENGTTIASPTIAGLGTREASIDVVLVIDVSGSMQGAPIAAALSAARSFLAGPPA
jgi:Mg-chelatase subunit ChlD